VQYNDRADVWSMNLRVGWLQAANTGLFVVYNDTRGLYELNPTPQRGQDRPLGPLPVRSQGVNALR